MEAILNRLRGTGDIIVTKYFAINGNILYAVYFALLFGAITEWYVGLWTGLLYVIGESRGWGKWVGTLCSPKYVVNYTDYEGRGFPYTHKIADFFVKETKNYYRYCQLALGIRGLWWGVLVYLSLFIFQDINIYTYLVVSLIWAIGFPFACYLAKLFPLNYKYEKVSIVGGWETQEVYYGFIHMVANIIVIYTIY